MFHVTERLLLRPTWPEDWQDVLAGIGDEAIARNLARVPWPYTEADARWWTAQGQDPAMPGFAVVESATGRLIGSIGIHANEEGDPEIGYWIARTAWGRGYATEAGRGVLAVARALGMRRLAAGHYVDNPASGRVLRKLGFVPTGKPARRFSLARGEEVDSIEFALDLDAPCTMPCAA
jgi:RimJ/RimL family protein N-acetyltransferase